LENSTAANCVKYKIINIVSYYHYNALNNKGHVWLIPLVDKRMDGRWNSVIPRLHVPSWAP